MRLEVAEGLREVDAIVGWLAGFEPTVWLLASMTADGMVLVSDETCAEYGAKVKRLAELIGVDL